MTGIDRLEGPAHVGQEKLIDSAIAEHSRPVREFAERNRVSFGDAHVLLRERERLDAQAGGLEPRSSGAAWLDTSELSEPPRPWSDEDWQRDKRRAEAAGVDLPYEVWQAFAESGVDGVWRAVEDRREAAERESARAWENELLVARNRERRAADVSYGGPTPGWVADDMGDGSRRWRPGP